MLKNYLTTAFRAFCKNKLYVLVNVLGMGIAMACCMTAYLLVAYNIEFDDYFNDKHIENIVKVMHHYETAAEPNGQELNCPAALAPMAVREISGILDFTRYAHKDGIVSVGEMAFGETIRFADSSFLRIFNLELLKGSVRNFSQPQSIFLSESMAAKYFADEDPIGKTMSVAFSGKAYDVVVGGVLRTLPLNSSFNIDALMRIEILLGSFGAELDRWDMDQPVTVLFKINDIHQRAAISKQLSRYLPFENKTARHFRALGYEILPFRQTVLKRGSSSNLRLPIPAIALEIFGTLAAMILLIACFNLTNTTLALTGKRLKEIGVRKVVGAGRLQIAGQFLFESVLTISLAVAAGFLIAQVIVPQFAFMWELQYDLSDLNNTNLLLALSILLFSAAVFAGIYPAIAKSKVSPILLFRGGPQTGGSGTLMKMLLVMQFSLSVMVFISGIIFTRNAGYQKDLDLGYDKDKIIKVTVQGEQMYDRLKNSIEKNPAIESIAGASSHISPSGSREKMLTIDTSSFETVVYEIGTGYFRTMGLSVISGRDFFSDGSEADYQSAVVDENFVRNHQLTDPLGVRVRYNDRLLQVIGVVRNHLSSLKQRTDAEHFYSLSEPENYTAMVIRTKSSDRLDVQAFVDREWKKLYPGKLFQSALQEDIVYNDAGSYNKNLKQILLFLTILGCMLSVSGVSALASLNVQRRTKEIGVRKVMGASVGGIIRLLSHDFAIILGLAALLGGAVGYILTDVLLTSLFFQHIPVDFVTAAACGLVIFAVGIFIAGATVFNAATVNPADSLRTE